MSRSDDERLADIREAAAEIEALVAAGRDAWDGDRVGASRSSDCWKRSAKRLAPLSDECRAQFAEVPWSDIVGLRTVLAHHYHRVDPNQVWTIAAVEVPRLLEQLDKIG